MGAGRASGIALAVLGVGGVAAGVVYGLLAQSAWDNAKSACTDASCPAATRAQAQSNHDTAVTDGTISTIGFISGGVLLAAGNTLFVALPSPTAPARSGALRITPTLGPGTAGLNLKGEF
jgi:hypothetical protein